MDEHSTTIANTPLGIETNNSVSVTYRGKKSTAVDIDNVPRYLKVAAEQIVPKGAGSLHCNLAKVPSVPVVAEPINHDTLLNTENLYADEMIKCFPTGSMWDGMNSIHESLLKIQRRYKFVISKSGQQKFVCNVKECPWAVNVVPLFTEDKVKKDGSNREKKKPKNNRISHMDSLCVISSAEFSHNHEYTVETYVDRVQKSGKHVTSLKKDRFSPFEPDAREQVVTMSRHDPTSQPWFSESKGMGHSSMTEDVLSSMDKFLALFSDQQHFDLFDTETESFADPTTLQGKELLKEYERDSYLNQKNDDFEAHNNIAGLAELYTDNDPFFDFRIKTGEDGTITGIAWMTGAMRDAFERYGTAVFTDMMKSAFNTSLFPYAAICVKLSTNKLDVATEGL